ncbi:MAG: hypothetical protein GY827_06655 [Cytophagales bacterium]|nr:hypothetical protein [Cytophagales bacterium]
MKYISKYWLPTLLSSAIACFMLVLWVYSYEEFTMKLAITYQKEDKLSLIRSQYVTIAKYSVLRYLSVLLFIVTLYFFKKLAILYQKLYYGLLQEVSFQKQLVVNEWKGFSINIKLYFCGIGVVLLFYRIYYAYILPFFIDEVFSYLYFVSKGFGVTITYYPGPNNHVCYNLLAGIFSLFSENAVFVMRCPAIILGLLTYIILFFILCRTSLSPFLALAVSSLLQVMFSYHYYALSGRGYVLYTLCAIILLYQLFKKSNYTIYYVLFAVVGLYTIPTFVYFLFPAFFIGFLRKSYKQWVLIHFSIAILTIICYSPILLFSGWQSLVANSWVKPVSFDVFIKSYGIYVANFFNYLLGLDLDIYWGFVLFALIWVVLYFMRGRHNKEFYFSALLFILLPLIILCIQQVTPFFRIWLYLLPISCTAVVLLLSKLIPVKYWGIVSVFCVLIGIPFLWNREFKEGYGFYEGVSKVCNFIQENKPSSIYVGDSDYYTLLSHYLSKSTSLDNSFQSNKTYAFLVLSKNNKKFPTRNYQLVFENEFIQLYHRLK